MAINNNSRALERMRDLQAEVGAMLDRFHLTGLPACDILDVVSAETEIWLARTQRAEAQQIETAQIGESA